jgi:hypothetical protein
MKVKIIIGICLFSAAIITTKAQVKISDDPVLVGIKPDSEMIQSDKVVVSATDINKDIKLTNLSERIVLSDKIVYDTLSIDKDTITKSSGKESKKTGESNDPLLLISISQSDELPKMNVFILASNDIILTLPSINNSDDGLRITIKNAGNNTDLVTVKPYQGNTISGNYSSVLTFWEKKTYVASGGKWEISSNGEPPAVNENIDETEGFESIAAVVAYLNIYMTGPMVVSLDAGLYEIDTMLTINLPYPVSFEGISYDETTISATGGAAGSPLFNCISACEFKNIMFVETSNYAKIDAIHFAGSATNNEVRNCLFTGFINGIVSSRNNNLRVSGTDFENSTGSGIKISAGITSGGILNVVECNFEECKQGIYLESGVSEVVSILNCTFYNTISGNDVCILRDPVYFTSFSEMYITENIWNNQGTYIKGIDHSDNNDNISEAYVINMTGM